MSDGDGVCSARLDDEDHKIKISRGEIFCERGICVDLSHDHDFFSEKVTLYHSKTPPENFLACLTVTGYALELRIVD